VNSRAALVGCVGGPAARSIFDAGFVKVLSLKEARVLIITTIQRNPNPTTQCHTAEKGLGHKQVCA